MLKNLKSDKYTRVKTENVAKNDYLRTRKILLNDQTKS